MSQSGGYVDLFLLPIPRKNLKRYREMARGFAKFVKKNGAIDYREFLGDDLHTKGMTPFTKNVKVKSGEGLMGAYVLYRSKAHRDQVNKKMFTDPDMNASMQESMPFDMKRMLYGGFKTFITM